MSSSDTPSAAEKRYPVCEIFASLQGEGFHTGTPAIFLRFSGCNRRCSFCDTDFSHSVAMTASDIVETLLACGPARHLVVTGGEPSLSLDTPLVEALKQAGFFIQVETNGSLPLPPGIDWVTCSPKEGPWKIGHIDELKVVFVESDGVRAEALRERFEATHRFLQPCDTPAGSNTAATVAYIEAHPWWRLSLQTHKMLDIR